MILWKLSWRSIWARRSRTLLTVLSIAAGVASVVAVLQATLSTRARLRQLHETMAARAALEVVAEDGKSFAAPSVQAVEGIAGVKVAVYCLRRFAILYASQQRAQVEVLGIGFDQYRLLRDVELVAGRAYSDAGEIGLEASVANRLGVGPDDRVRMLTRSSFRPVELRIAGVFRFRGASALQESTAVLMPLAQLQRLWRAPDQVSDVQIVLDQSAPVDSVSAELAQRLPSNLLVQKVESPADLGAGTEALVEQGLSVSVVLSVVAAMFIVLNTFMMSVMERQKQLALMRVVGATPQQVRLMLLRESLLTGIVGTAVGIVGGVVVGYLLTLGMQTMFLVDPPPISIRAEPILIGLVFGPLITLVAVLYPVDRACRTAPLTVLWPAPTSVRAGRLGRLFLLGAVTLVLACAVVAAALRGKVPADSSVSAIGAALSACVLFLPWLLRPASYSVYLLGKRWFPVAMLLAQRQILRNVSRSTLTIGVLFVVSCAGMSVGTSILAVVDDVESWFDRTIVGDFLVRTSLPRIDVSQSAPMPRNVDEAIQRLPGVESIDRFSFISSRVNDRPALLLLRDVAIYETSPIDLKDADPASVRRSLLDGQAVLGSVLAHQLQARTGDDVTVAVGSKRQAVRVAGIVGEYTSSGSVIMMDRHAAKRLFAVDAIHGYMIKCDPGATRQVGEALAALVQEHGLILQSLPEFRQTIRAMVSGITGGMWLLLALSLLVAAFGIVNTLMVSVLEQTRYIGLLRVIGATRAQIQGTIVCQALMIGLIALVPGIAVGALLSLVVTYVFRALFGHAIAYEAHLGLLGGYFLAGLALTIGAAVIPGWRAARLQPLDAIHDE